MYGIVMTDSISSAEDYKGVNNFMLFNDALSETRRVLSQLSLNCLIWNNQYFEKIAKKTNKHFWDAPPPPNFFFTIALYT